MRVNNKSPQIPGAYGKANTKKTLIVCSGIKGNKNGEEKLSAPAKEIKPSLRNFLSKPVLGNNDDSKLFPTVNRLLNWVTGTGKSTNSFEIIEGAKETVYHLTEQEIKNIEFPPGNKTLVQVIEEIKQRIPPGRRLNLSKGVNNYGLGGSTSLSHAKLAKLDLRNVNLQRADLYRANLTEANLQNANLSQASLIEANLSNVNLRGANLGGAFLTNANLENADLTDANLAGADLTCAVFPEGNWMQVIAKTEEGKPNLRGTNLSNTNLPRNADLRELDLKGARLECLDLEEADLTEANFEGIRLRKTKLPHGWIQQIAKDENGFPNLRGAILLGIDLTKVDFTGVNLEEVTIDGCQLPNDPNWIQKIKGKSLKNAVLINTEFGVTNFEGVNLEGANLSGSQLNDPNWPQLILNKSLRGANLSNVVGLSQTNLTGVDLTEAVCPDQRYLRYLPLNWTEQIAKDPETGFLKADWLKDADFRGLKQGLINEDCIHRSSLTDQKMSNILWQVLDKSQGAVDMPFCSEEHKKLLGEILLAAQGEPIPNENWGNGLSVVFQTLSEPQNIHLLSELLAQTRDIDVSIKRDAILTLQNASPEEIKNIAQSIQDGFINQEAASLSAFQHFSLHFSDPQSPFNQAFRQAYKNTILNNLDAKQTVLLNEILKGENSETRIGKIRALETCWKNPQLNLMLDRLFLEDHRNKPPHLNQFLELVGNIGFYKQILSIDTSDNFLPSEALTSSLQNLPPLAIGNYLDLVPKDKKSEVQKLLAGEREEEKVNFLRKWLEDNDINCSNIKPKLQFRWHQQEMLALLSKELPRVKESAFNHVLNELSIPVENSENLTEKDIKTFMQAIAYYKIAHENSAQDQAIFKELIEKTLRGNSKQFILDLGTNWMNQVKQTNPDFNPDKLRIPCQGQVGNYLIELESSPLEFFNMSKDLRDHSCLNITSGSNSDKVLNHALNLHTILAWIKNPENGELIGRQLMTISDEGSLIGYPVYLFGGDNRNEISKSTQEFASAYLKFLGLSPASQGSYSKPRSLTGVPDYYDSPEWSVDSSHITKQKGKEIQIITLNEENPPTKHTIKEKDNPNQQKNNDIEPNKDQDGGIVKPNPNTPVQPNSGDGAAEDIEAEPQPPANPDLAINEENLSNSSSEVKLALASRSRGVRESKAIPQRDEATELPASTESPGFSKQPASRVIEKTSDPVTDDNPTVNNSGANNSLVNWGELALASRPGGVQESEVQEAAAIPLESSEQSVSGVVAKTSDPVTDNNSTVSNSATIAKPTSISFSKWADSCTQLPTTKGNPTNSELTSPKNGTTAEPNLVGREIPQSGRESLSVSEAPESSEAGGEVPENTSEQVPTAKPTSITDFSKWADSCTQLPTTAENSPNSELTSPDSGENNNPLKKDAEIPWTNKEVVQSGKKLQTYDSESIRESALVADIV